MGILSHIFGLGLQKWIRDANPDPEVIGGLLTCDDRWVTLKSGEEAGNHPKHEVFMERVHPLVESFLADLSKKHEWVKKSLDSFYSLRELRF